MSFAVCSDRPSIAESLLHSPVPSLLSCLPHSGHPLALPHFNAPVVALQLGVLRTRVPPAPGNACGMWQAMTHWWLPSSFSGKVTQAWLVLLTQGWAEPQIYLLSKPAGPSMCEQGSCCPTGAVTPLLGILLGGDSRSQVQVTSHNLQDERVAVPLQVVASNDDCN